MNFANISLPSVAAGLIGLAAALYVLQWLRVRYREVPVITTLFWREALEEAPARVLRQRFRHLAAYLLILAICALIWLAIAGPEWSVRQGSEHYVLLLDGSAGMARGERFEQAVKALERDAHRLNKDVREVMWVGGSVKTLLAPGEDAVLLQKRMQSLAPQATPAAMERALQQLATVHRAGEKTTLRIYGDAPVRPHVLKIMPPSHRVARATELPMESTDAQNAGITALGIAEASSGRWSKVDALLRAQSTAGGNVDLKHLEITLDGAALEGIEITPIADGGYLLKDLPAAGGLLQARLREGDALALDNRASLRLPQRPLIKVQLSASLEAVLGPVLAADPAIQRITQNPDVVIRRGQENLGADRPALVFVPMAAQPAAFSLTWPEETLSAGESDPERLAGTMQALGLDRIDATALAQAARRPIEVAVEVAPQRAFSVWEELLLDDFNFTRSRSFPLFVAESVRWLAETPAWYPYVAAGRPLPQPYDTQRASFADEQARAIDTLGASFVPEHAGELRQAGGAQPLQAALLDAEVTLARRSSITALGEPEALSGDSRIEPVTTLLLLALLLLAVEWFLYQRGGIP